MNFLKKVQCINITLYVNSGNIKNYTAPQTSTLIQHSNKLHILSPISDKSSQEPISETSDNNRNNNSQKCSPEEVASNQNQETLKTKRRLPQNKNLLNLANLEIQGSDSGISIQSREGKLYYFHTILFRFETIRVVFSMNYVSLKKYVYVPFLNYLH